MFVNLPAPLNSFEFETKMLEKQFYKDLETLKLLKRLDKTIANHITLIGVGRKWVSYGCNTHRYHSEVIALSRFRKQRKHGNTVLVNIRISRCNRIGMSAPCKHCVHYIKRKLFDMKINHIVYSIQDDFKFMNVYDFLGTPFEFISSGKMYKKWRQ